MLRWMGQRRKDIAKEAADVAAAAKHDDTAAAAAVGDGVPVVGDGVDEKFSVKRSVYLPRVALKNNPAADGAVDTSSAAWTENFYLRGDVKFGRINPLYIDTYKMRRTSRQSTPTGEKSSSSGYGGSSNLYSDHHIYTEMRTKVDGVLEQNPQYVKSIQVAKRKNKSSHSSGSSGTLSTIPEGRIDFTIPRPIWPQFRNQRLSSSAAAAATNNPEYDSLVDEAVLLYTSLSNHQAETDKSTAASIRTEVSVKEILLDLLDNVNATMEGKGALSAEEMLKRVNERIADSIDALKHTTEEEMRLLCINLRNSRKVDSVVRAFAQGGSSTSTSGNSSQSSPEWSARLRGPEDPEDIYHLPSSSSSGFSDCMFNKDGLTVINHANNNLDVRQLPMFVHDDLTSVPNGVRNAMIYGTLCRSSGSSVAGHGGSVRLALPNVMMVTGRKRTDAEVDPVGNSRQTQVGKGSAGDSAKQSLLKVNDEKPSVWEQYYGVNVYADEDDEGGARRQQPDVAIDVNYVPKPTDIPIFPGGRPEADFTLDVPRSEMLTKRMKQDKKWRCRCRLLTSFFGLVFFLLSVMAVSLMLTRGRKMFGSMV